MSVVEAAYLGVLVSVGVAVVRGSLRRAAAAWRAGDLLGRRKVLIAGLLLFSAASLAGGFATSPA